MLRSLVGSEMCIRDRYGINKINNNIVSIIMKLCSCSIRISQYVLRQFNACLLYTSDAADDLLCVDLGGRRNIKKKKQHINLYLLLYTIYYYH